MKLHNLPLKKLTAAIGTCLVLGVSGPMLAQTNLVVENDGLMLSAFVDSSSQEVLTMSIRIIGPDGFVFEDRVEGGAIDWIPEQGLSDGLYHWEAWTVTIKPSAGARALISEDRQATYDDASLQNLIENTPIERFYRSEDKSVTTQSGSFRVRGGWLEAFDETEHDSLSGASPTNRAARIIGKALDVLFPTAHAQNVTASGFNPSVVWDRNDDADDYVMNASNLRLRLRHPDQNLSTHYAFSVYRESPNNSLVVRGNSPTGRPQIGIGTSLPDESLHIQSNSAAIRLTNPGLSSSWYVKNRNAGRLEIGETPDAGAFVIEPDLPDSALHVAQFRGCVNFGEPLGSVCGPSQARIGINRENPAVALHIRGESPGGFIRGIPAIRLEGSTGSAIQLSGDTDLAFSRVGGNFGIMSVSGNAPSDSLRIDSDGNIGMGTASPATALHMEKDGRAGVILAAGDGEQADMTYRTGGINRFIFRVNAGSNDFEVARRNQSGGFLDSPIRISYNNGDVQISNALILSESSTPTPPGSGAKLYVDSSSGNLMVRFANGTVKTIETN